MSDRPISPAVRIKQHTDKIRLMLRLMDKSAGDSLEVLRLSALISYELTSVMQIQPTKKQ